MNAEDLVQDSTFFFAALEGKLDAGSAEDFIVQFRHLYSQPDAIAATSVVYFWATEKPICRLRGSSNIIYIGKTIQSLSQRHTRYAAIEGGDSNWLRYDHIIKNFGPIKTFNSKHKNPEKLERMLLRRFYSEHLDIPPLNRRSE